MISDEDLLLYHYRDGLEDAERARIGAALAAKPELAQRFHQLVARLDAAAAMAAPEVPVPLETQARWRAALDQVGRGQTTRAAPPARRPFTSWLSAAAAVLVAVIAAMQLRHAPAPAQSTQNSPPANSAAYERGLESHLASTERQLVSLQNATPAERAKLIESIIEQNRIYALAAEKAGEPQLARVLRAFTPVLESLQEGGGDTSADLDQLEFELRAMQGRLGAGKASKNHSTTL
jgi:hypothetical protein